MKIVEEPVKEFVVVDVETTGGGIYGNRVTEVCAVKLRDGEIIDRFESLVDPECIIPAFITGLTGIDNDMVAGAPVFADIAEELFAFFKNAVFVAHNVNFDYNVLRGEFKRAGKVFVSKKLCTVRLARKVFPGYHSYSLGKLCSSMKIPLVNRHRAAGDTDATVILFQRILEEDKNGAIIFSFLHPRSRQATLPPHLGHEDINSLPDTPGVYFFRNEKGKVIYVGKAKNIKKRVIGHFYDKKNKEYHLGQETYSIDHQETGSELVALLVEAENIISIYPKHNRAQKRPVTPYCIIPYENQRGIIQLALMKKKVTGNTIAYYYGYAEAIAALERMCETHNLCPRFCGLQESAGRCSHYKIKKCCGICVDEEEVAPYNKRVRSAIKSLGESQKTDYILITEGRTEEENGFVQVENGMYQGYGFVDKQEQLEKVEDFEPYLIRQKDSYYTERILKGYVNRLSESGKAASEMLVL
ncbi:MAG: exonuclease domain-containing protein [Leeuwenhoekiella sp.]